MPQKRPLELRITLMDPDQHSAYFSTVEVSREDAEEKNYADLVELLLPNVADVVHRWKAALKCCAH